MEKGNAIQITQFELSTVEIVQQFTRKCSVSETYEDVFKALAVVLVDFYDLKYCKIYESISDIGKLFCVVDTQSNSKSADFIPFGTGIEGKVASEQQAIISDETNEHQSQICTPIVFHGELLGVICASYPAPNYFSENHLITFQLLAEISASLLVRIRQKVELDYYKNELERTLADRNNALDVAIQTVSNQFSEIKFQRDKKDFLLREVHHRVNNNLQMLSSLVNLYLNDSNQTESALTQIQQRIQHLSAIHLVLLKSLELSQISVTGFLADLASSIRYNIADCYLVIETDVNESIPAISMDTMVPFGMLIFEMIKQILDSNPSVKQLKLQFQLELNDENYFEFRIANGDSDLKLNHKHSNFSISATLIEALIDQIDGKINPPSNTNLWQISFLQTNETE